MGITHGFAITPAARLRLRLAPRQQGTLVH
jgi:hypothetical protein